MRFNVTFNQLELMAYNERHSKEKQIDFKDAIIMQQLYHLSNWGEVEKIKLEDGEYFWAAYGKLNTELPCLGFKSNTALGKRIKARLLKNDLLRLHVEWKDNSKTFWRFTETGMKIAEPGKDPNSSTFDGTRGARPAEREGHVLPNERGTSDGTNNYNTIDNLTNDEREALSHFDFLKKIYKEDFNNWETTYKGKIYDMVQFINAFNNDMPLEQTKKNHLLINRLEKYSRSWISRQSEKDKPHIDHPSFKKLRIEKPKNFL